MQLSKTTIAELKQNLAEYRSKVQAIEALLLDIDGSQGGTNTTPTVTTKAAEPLFLRKAIRAVIKEAEPAGLAVGEIRERLKQMGVEVGGKTPISTRISIELYELKKLRLVKLIQGKYRATLKA